MDKPLKYWSYSEEPQSEVLIIEHTLKYADIDSIKAIIDKYGLSRCKDVWERFLLPDKRLIKLNYFLAKFIFKISFIDDEITDYLRQHDKTRRDYINEIPD
ncbi:MAG TPA: hypothetical protein DHV28_15290 [Ignavibacteriales bacterium]|nr:hypothetical protein [Ignavibacteriales bacterium]